MRHKQRNVTVTAGHLGMSLGMQYNQRYSSGTVLAETGQLPLAAAHVARACTVDTFFLASDLAAAMCCCTGVYASVHYAAVVCLQHAGRSALCCVVRLELRSSCMDWGYVAGSISGHRWSVGWFSRTVMPGLCGDSVLLPAAASERIVQLGFCPLLLCLYTAASSV